MFNFSSGAYLSQANIVLHSVEGAFQIPFSHLCDTTLFHRSKFCCTISFFCCCSSRVPPSCRSFYRISCSKLYRIGLKAFIVHWSNHVKLYTAWWYKWFFATKREKSKWRNYFLPGIMGMTRILRFGLLFLFKLLHSVFENSNIQQNDRVKIQRMYRSVIKVVNCQETNVLHQISQFLFQAAEKQEQWTRTWFLLPFLPIPFAIWNHSILSHCLPGSCSLYFLSLSP